MSISSIFPLLILKLIKEIASFKEHLSCPLFQVLKVGKSTLANLIHVANLNGDDDDGFVRRRGWPPAGYSIVAMAMVVGDG
ncbi:hypothetical protein M8C21_031101 [Ambrosia artemisiifolia]|uniref:Uncharacterized protein n=1 Tax=Ambrosia artemisiifolia TaxID=4212 RepID=A0AAD5G9J9_AMBAR|nr:hypothetical protein M8C21_031101 [Ambrosia artemisiifolia]